MIPSLFSRNDTKSADRGPVFSEDDIRKLIQSFPPPEPRPGKECLVRSLSGRNLVRSDTVVKRFRTLLQTATGPIFLNGLHNELGVYDVQWLLAQEDDTIFFTRDRTRLLPETHQKQILSRLRIVLDKGGVDLDKTSAESDVTTTTFRRIVAAQDASLSLTDLEDGRTYSSELLKGVKRDVLAAIVDTQSSVILSDKFSQVPISWLEKTSRDLVTDKGNDIDGVVERASFGLHFVPKSLLVQLESESKQAQDTYVRTAVDELNTKGYCDISPSQRPKVIQKSAIGKSNLGQMIQESYAEKFPEASIVQLSPKQGAEPSTFLIREDTLSNMTRSLAVRASQVAEEQWQTRKLGEEVSFDASLVSATLTKDSATPALDLSILNNESSAEEIQQGFNTKITELQQTTTQQLIETVQTSLLTPLKMYTLGAEGIKDTTLQPRISDFVKDWARKEHIPSNLQQLKTSNLLVSKPQLRDLEKYSDAITAAKTLDEITASTAKFARKLKIEQPDPETLQAEKRAILSKKVQGMQRMKRGSDLLQNLVWVLLAEKREGLFMSSGKDTSRMIKEVKVAGVEGEVVKMVEGWRDVVKEGKDTEVERKEMRELAVRTFERMTKDGDTMVRSGEGGEVAETEDMTDDAQG